jgi:hypothetical protein
MTFDQDRERNVEPVYNDGDNRSKRNLWVLIGVFAVIFLGFIALERGNTVSSPDSQVSPVTRAPTAPTTPPAPPHPATPPETNP